jgi:hypothetical protein
MAKTSQELGQLKKPYEKLQKEVEGLKAHTVTMKRGYVTCNKVKKNPQASEEHFLRLHGAEKQYELVRFDLYRLLSTSVLTGELMAVEQTLSLLYSAYVSII